MADRGGSTDDLLSFEIAGPGLLCVCGFELNTFCLAFCLGVVFGIHVFSYKESQKSIFGRAPMPGQTRDQDCSGCPDQSIHPARHRWCLLAPRRVHFLDCKASPLKHLRHASHVFEISVTLFKGQTTSCGIQL